MNTPTTGRQGGQRGPRRRHAHWSFDGLVDRLDTAVLIGMVGFLIGMGRGGAASVAVVATFTAAAVVICGIHWS